MKNYKKKEEFFKKCILEELSKNIQVEYYDIFGNATSDCYDYISKYRVTIKSTVDGEPLICDLVIGDSDDEDNKQFIKATVQELINHILSHCPSLIDNCIKKKKQK